MLSGLRSWVMRFLERPGTTSLTPYLRLLPEIASREPALAALADGEQRSAESFGTVLITADGADLGAAGLKRPTATWTYLVQDNPFGTDLDRAMRSVARALRKLLPP